jgi:Ca2+-binding EF-hand superfamily protein
MIDRLDRNGNGMLDPDEMEGPAQFMISRLQRDDPSIRTDRPIPISKFKEAFDRMRATRGGEGGGEGGRRGDGGREEMNAKLAEAMTAPPLVPGFGGEAPVAAPVLGFGPSAELMSVAVSDADLKAAEDQLARYDKNRDSFLAGDEITSRWTGNPMDFDRNGDGRLSLSELALRAARLRVAQEEVNTANNKGRQDNRQREQRQAAGETPPPYNGRKSFATIGRSLPEGLPGWFAEKDVDGDQQVSMAEYSDKWSSDLVAEFQSFDLNGDGLVTPQECLTAVRNGATSTLGGGAGAPGVGITGRETGSGRPSGPSAPGQASPGKSTAGGAAGGGGAVGQPDEKTMQYAERIIQRNDKNKDGALTHDEWKNMLIDISAADANKDGRITPLEYAQWTMQRSAR